jgi:hypothetical protein
MPRRARVSPRDTEPSSSDSGQASNTTPASSPAMAGPRASMYGTSTVPDAAAPLKAWRIQSRASRWLVAW